MKHFIHFVLLTFFICSFSSLGAEEPPEEKKIKWADIEELPEDYIEWDVPFAQMEEYDLTKDTVPKLANPHPMCKAPQEYDSYDGGKRKLPRQYKRTDKTCWEDSNGYDYVVRSFDLMGTYWDAPQIKALDMVDAPQPEVTPSNEKLDYVTEKAKGALEELKKSYNYRCSEHYLGKGHFLFTTQNDEDRCLTTIVEKAYDLRIERDGKVTKQEIDFLHGYEFVATFSLYYSNREDTGAVVFLKNNKMIIYYDINDSKSVEFAPGWKLGENIWAPPMYFETSRGIAIPSHLYPILPIEERNFGHKRGELLPPVHYDPESGRIDSYRRQNWYDKNEIKPEQKKSRIFLFNVESGEIIHDFEDIHRFYAVSPDHFIIPHTAQNGEWMITGMNCKGVTYNLPMSCILSSDIRRIERKEGSYLSFFFQSHYALLDMLENKLYRHTYTKPVDETAFKDSLPYPYRTHLFISESYEENGVAFRNVWRYDWNFKLRYHFRIRDVFGSSATNCLILEGHTYFLLYDGHKFLKIRTRELPQ